MCVNVKYVFYYHFNFSFKSVSNVSSLVSRVWRDTIGTILTAQTRPTLPLPSESNSIGFDLSFIGVRCAVCVCVCESCSRQRHVFEFLEELV